MTERTPNVRPARILERSYANSGHHSRLPVTQPRGGDEEYANRAYRGSHRAAGQHHADRQTPGQRRDSRVGRHHADPDDAERRSR